jgi:hypothetical protein
MMAHSSQSAESFMAPRAEGLFKTCVEVLGARRNAYRHHDAHQFKNNEAAPCRRLEALLDQLGLAANPVAIQCFGHVDGVMERAIANITDWLSYLSKDCVSSMVRDGWHWST